MNGRRESSCHGNAPATEDPSRDQRQKGCSERPDKSGSDLRESNPLGMSQCGERQKRGIARRSEEEDVGPVGISALVGNFLRGGDVRACVPEPKRAKADNSDRREPGGEREGEKESEIASPELRKLTADG